MYTLRLKNGKKINDISVAPLCVCGAAWSCITEIFSHMILYEKNINVYNYRPAD